MKRRYEIFEATEIKIGCARTVEIDEYGNEKQGYISYYCDEKGERVFARGYEKLEVCSTKKQAMSKALYHYHRNMNFGRK